MNEHVEFQRSVAEHIAGVGVAPPSDAFHDELISRAGRSGQRPEWLAVLKEPPMRHDSTLAVGSPTARIAAILVATILLLAALAGAGIAGSRLLAAGGIIVVDPSGNGTTTTIQDALDMADDGDQIVVKPGVYEAPITITDDVVLRGEERDSVILAISPDGPTIDFWFGPAPYGILLEDTAADVSGLTIQGFRTVDDEPGSVAISVVGGSPHIHDVTTDDSNGSAVDYQGAASGELRDSSLQGAVFVQDASVPTIEDNEILWNIIVRNRAGTEPVTIRRNRLSGVTVEPDNFERSGNTAPALIEENVLRLPDVVPSGTSEDYLGIDVMGSGDTVIRMNDVAGFYQGIRLQRSASLVEGNTLTDNSTAIAATMSDARIVGNVVNGGSLGINVFDGDGQLIDNEVRGVSGRGIALSGSPTLRGNTSCDNGEDLWVEGNANPDIDDSNEICTPPADT